MKVKLFEQALCLIDRKQAKERYEVAPGYMGAQEFTVDRALFEKILD